MILFHLGGFFVCILCSGHCLSWFQNFVLFVVPVVTWGTIFFCFCSLRKNFLETYHIPSPFTPWTRAEGLKNGHYVMAFLWSSTYRKFLMHLLANELCGPLFTGRSNGVWAFWNCTFTSICRVFLHRLIDAFTLHCTCWVLVVLAT